MTHRRTPPKVEVQGNRQYTSATKRPTRQREREYDRTRWGDKSQDDETSEEELDLNNLDPEEAVWIDDGELIHEETGITIKEERIDPGPEWRAFNYSERQSKSRVGALTIQTMHDKGLTTAIDWKDKDAYGRFISSKKRSRTHRLCEWQERIRTKDAGERNLQFALSKIDRMASVLGIPRSVRGVASVIYRRAFSEDLIRGHSTEGVATLALYAACRKERIPRSFEEISEVPRVEHKEIGRTYRYISQELDLGMRLVDFKKYVPRSSSELDLSREVQPKANEVIETTAEQGPPSGKSPTGFAATAIYAVPLLCNEKKTQHEVVEVAQVTEVTTRNRYQEQIEAMGIHT